MSVDVSKSNVVHFRPKSVTRTSFELKCGVNSILTTDKFIPLRRNYTERAFGLQYHSKSRRTKCKPCIWPFDSKIQMYRRYDLSCVFKSIWYFSMASDQLWCLSPVNKVFFWYKSRTGPGYEGFPWYRQIYTHSRCVCLGIWVGNLPLLNRENVSAITGTDWYIWMSGRVNMQVFFWPNCKQVYPTVI